MGLTIFSSDDEKEFNIGYIGFTVMRSFFILHYGRKYYEAYREITDYYARFYNILNHNPPVNILVSEDVIAEAIGDLDILISHSDCDGLLTSNECKRLKEVLFIDEDRILEVYKNKEYDERIIRKMYEFKELIEYCADNSDVELIFG